MPHFDIKGYCALIQRFRITYGYVAPPIVLLLAKDPGVASYNLTSVRMLTSGAAPLTRELVLAVYKRLNIPVKQAYGLTETSPVTHIQVSGS
jgi:4-coumarate--CoA ligase